MNQLQHHFQKILLKSVIKRQDVVELKHQAHTINPQISNELAHILQDTSGDLPLCKLEKLKKIYKKHF